MRLPRLDNAAISLILRSPLHRLLSGAVVLIRHTGRRTGHVYTTPVQYIEHEGRLVVAAFGGESKQWWRNVLAAPNVEVLHRGRWLKARADRIRDNSNLVDLYTDRFKWARRQLRPGDAFMVLSADL